LSHLDDRIASRFFVDRLAGFNINPGVNAIQPDTPQYDGLGEYDPVGTFTFAPIRAGYYELQAQVAFAALAVGNGQFDIYLVDDLGFGRAFQSYYEAPNIFVQRFSCHALTYLEPPRTVGIIVDNHTVAVRIGQTGQVATFFCGYRVK
jgi:hypothetical protein